MYLVVITRKRNVGSLLGHAVWKAADFDVISYKKTVLHLSEIQVSKNGSLIPKEIQEFKRAVARKHLWKKSKAHQKAYVVRSCAANI